MNWITVKSMNDVGTALLTNVKVEATESLNEWSVSIIIIKVMMIIMMMMMLLLL